MKFSEIEKTSWEELQPYLDTCLLPLTGLTGEETPWQVTESLEKLRDLMDHVEIPFKGRVVTYPSVQYRMEEADPFIYSVNALCLKLKSSQFKHVIVISADESLAKCEFHASDLFISNRWIKDEATSTRAGIVSLVQDLWNKRG
jgi:23S rRNA (pseudouridine1915-N3)-methyltransferase